MPRDLPIGNGDMLVTFDPLYRVRDLYFPYVGKYNHTGGHVQRFGVWADGAFAWVDDAAWTRTLRYLPDTLVTDVTLRHEGLGVELRCQDAVDFHEPVWIRRTVARDLRGARRDVRLFFHIDLSIEENPVGDTANYDPELCGIVLYKGGSYFLFNACDASKCGIDAWAIGTKRLGGHEGTWRDAEDGALGRNAIAQGSVDATVGVHMTLEPGGTNHATTWLACGANHKALETLNSEIYRRTPEKYLSRTEAYWRLWVSKEPVDLSGVPEHHRQMLRRSQLVMRTQIDNRGAIIAANDSDITHFAGDHYSYCWPRDGALVAHALIQARQSELSRAFFRYCGRVIEAKGFFLHKYTPDARLASSWHPWVISGQRVLPVQQDETALVVWALRKHFEAFADVEFVKPLYTPLVVGPAKWMAEYREKEGPHAGLPKPSWDLWEERRGVHTFTVAATIAGLRAAAAFALDFGDTKRAAYWLKAAQEILEALQRQMWDPAARRFARMAVPAYNAAGLVESYARDMTPDSANAALWMFGALPPDDPLARADTESTFELLSVKTPVGGVARYQNDYYHQVERRDLGRVPGNPWLICTLWRAQHVIATARTLDDLRPAAEILDWAGQRASPSGVMAEQFNPHDGAPLSVSPLTWSHATVVSTVLEYARKHAELRSLARA